MKSRLGGTSTLVCLALLAVGCSSGSGGTGSEGAPSPGASVGRDEYALKLAEWLCDDRAACCDASGQPFDREACVRLARDRQLSRVASEEANSGRVFDEEMAATCVARLQETPADCGAERRVRECFQTYDGVRELGDECTYKGQCRGYRRGDVACIEGRCTERLAAGESCPDLSSEADHCTVCRPGASCHEAEDGNPYCYAFERRRGVAGDPCGFSLPDDPATVSILTKCAYEDGLYCSDEGVCEPFAIGGTCTWGVHCGPGARCVDNVCTAGLPAGATCHSSFSECGPGLYCLWTEFNCTDQGSCELFEGHCAVPSGEGEACGRFVDCAPGLRCDSASPDGEGNCVSFDPAAERCDRALEKLTRLPAS
jgi:hypothetical protein